MSLFCKKVRDIKRLKLMNEHQVKHKWREEIILPLRCIVNNINFLTSKCEKYILTTDGVKAKVESYEVLHICTLDELVKRIYGLTTWEFIKRWFDNGEEFDSSHFVYIKSTKV